MSRRRSAPIAVALALSFSLSFSLFAVRSAGAAEAAGAVKSVGGSAFVRRGAETLPAHPGLRLLEGDVLETGPDGSLGVILRDDAVLSLGPGSVAAIDRFAFAPAEGRLGLVVRVARGTLAYLSGLIGKLAPDSSRFETPVATVGVRGTRLAIRVAD